MLVSQIGIAYAGVDGKDDPHQKSTGQGHNTKPSTSTINSGSSVTSSHTGHRTQDSVGSATTVATVDSMGSVSSHAAWQQNEQLYADIAAGRRSPSGRTIASGSDGPAHTTQNTLGHRPSESVSSSGTAASEDAWNRRGSLYQGIADGRLSPSGRNIEPEHHQSREGTPTDTDKPSLSRTNNVAKRGGKR